jgi:hypothetical protein
MYACASAEVGPTSEKSRRGFNCLRRPAARRVGEPHPLSRIGCPRAAARPCRARCALSILPLDVSCPRTNCTRARRRVVPCPACMPMGKQDFRPQEAHRVVCGPHRPGPRGGGLAGWLGPGGVQLHVRLPVRVPILQRPPVLVIEQQLSLRVPSVGSPRLLLRRRQMEGLLLQLRLLRKWHRAPKQRIHNTRTSVSHVMCARACRASTVLTLLLLLGIVGLAGLIETLFFVTVRK